MISLKNMDCQKFLKNIPDNTFTSVITDPPYGISFMEKSWDRTFPKREIWEEVLRTTKPGGYLLCFGSPRVYHRVACAIEDAGWLIRDCIMWYYVSGLPKGKVLESGYHTGLKPAYEPILVAMKPLDGTYTNNALEHGVAGYNIEACRCEGRHPANIVLSEEVKEQVNQDVGNVPVNPQMNYVENNFKFYKGKNKSKKYFVAKKRGKVQMEGSRLFFCVKAGRKEKEFGLEDTETRTTDDGRKTSVDNPYLRGKTERRNFHPTVKPVDLMRYLCRLTKPPEGVEDWVLDPFMGSGTTGMAALKEGRNFCGVEIDRSYFEIAERRIKACQKK